MAVGPEFAEAGGIADSALSDILPAAPTGGVTTGAFRPALSETGRRHPITAGLPGTRPGDAPWGSWMRQIDVIQKRGDVLMTGTGGRPLLLVDRIEDGRVAMVLSDTIWLWARGWEGGGPHGELLRRLAHWLMQEPDLDENALTAEINAGTLTVTRRAMTGSAPALTVTAPDGTAITAAAEDQGDGRWIARLPAGQPGLWRVVDSTGLTAIAAAGSPSPIELGELTASPERLAPVATATGGAVAWLAEGGVPDPRRVSAGAATAGRGWIGLVERGDHLVDGLREFDLIPAAILLLLGLGGLALAWRREAGR